LSIKLLKHLLNELREHIDSVDKEIIDEIESKIPDTLLGEDGHGSSNSPYEYSMGQGLADQELLRIKKFQEGDSFRDG